MYRKVLLLLDVCLSCCSEDFFSFLYKSLGGGGDQRGEGPCPKSRLVWACGVTAKPMTPSSLEQASQPMAKFLLTLPSSQPLAKLALGSESLLLRIDLSNSPGTGLANAVARCH